MPISPIVTIIGAGRIGRTLGLIIATSNPDVVCRFWDIREEVRTPGLTSMSDAVKDASVLIFAVPSTALQSVTADLGNLAPDTIVVTISKGAPSATIISPAEFFLKHLPDQPLVVIGGPMMAEEMSAARPGEAVLATTSPAAAKIISELLRHAHLASTNSDRPIDVSRAGVLKNLYATIVGMIDGGDLSPELHQRGHHLAEAEFIHVGKLLGLHESVLLGPAGLGDFRTTIHSPHSRNRRAGEELVRNNIYDSTAESLHSFQPVLRQLSDPNSCPLLTISTDIVAGTHPPARLYQLITRP